MKKEVINIRVSSDFKTELEMLCELKGMKLSDFGRDALQEHLNSILDETCKKDSKQENESNSGKDDLLQSLEFAKFVLWLYNIKTNQFMDEPVWLYEKQLNLIKGLQEHRLFYTPIRKELDKIRIELEDRIRGIKGDFHQFKFLTSGQPCSFNFDLFAEFLKSLRFDSEEGKTYRDLGNGIFIG